MKKGRGKIDTGILVSLKMPERMLNEKGRSKLNYYRLKPVGSVCC